MSSRRHFDETFKREAVELALSDDRPLSEVARSLDLNPSLLRRWKNAYQSNGLLGASGSGQAEMVRLRRQLSQVQQERDILKKALAIFSRSKP